MKCLFIVNDPPYGTERVHNALRLAHTLLKKEPQTKVTVFLMADSVVGAKAGQKTPEDSLCVRKGARALGPVLRACDKSNGADRRRLRKRSVEPGGGNATDCLPRRGMVASRAVV